MISTTTHTLGESAVTDPTPSNPSTETTRDDAGTTPHDPVIPTTPDSPSLSKTQSTPATTPVPPSSIGPNHRDLWLLVVGLLLGILAGPAVFGRWAPDQYEHFFANDLKAQRIEAMADLREISKLNAVQSNRQEVARALAETGVTPEAIDEAADAVNADIAKLQQPIIDDLRQRQVNLEAGASANLGRLLTLVLLLLGAALLETLWAPEAITIRRRLITVRFALLALLLAYVAAQPAWLIEVVDPVFTGALIVAVVVVAIVPISRRAKA